MAKRDASGLDVAAEKIGSTLGRLAAQGAALDRQRRAVADQVRKAIAQGQSLLNSLTSDSAGDTEAEYSAKGTRKAKGSRTPAAMKAKMRESWKPAGQTSAPKAQTKPGDVRATVRATSSRQWTNRQPGRG